MSTQAEAADQVVKIMLDGSEHALRIAGAGAKQLAILIWALLKDQKRTKGKTRLAGMLRSGKELRIFPVKADELKKFCKEAKKYGVLYCALRQKNNPDGVVDVMARAEDASKISRIFERLQIADVDMASVRAELVQSKESPTAEQTPPLDAEAAFVEEMLSPAPPRNQTHKANPTLAAGEHPSAPSSKTASLTAFEQGSGRPSVRAELDRLRREQRTGRRRTEPIRTEHTAPRIIRKENNR
ncbi:MAG: PcfB family protein [Oscillospiraceae bacterium]|nr:PcfB family protein [Oscillospiraceae bacterium]